MVPGAQAPGRVSRRRNYFTRTLLKKQGSCVFPVYPVQTILTAQINNVFQVLEVNVACNQLGAMELRSCKNNGVRHW